MRAAIHDFESRGQPARAALIDTVRVLPADNVLPELAQPLTEERVAIPGEGIPDRLSDSELLMA